jgi:hypothetical protein
MTMVCAVTALPPGAALKPMVIEPPFAAMRFDQLSGARVYCVPAWPATCAPQMFVTVAGSVKVSDQSVMSLAPWFVTVICPVKPEPQSLVFWKTISTWAEAVTAAQRQSAAIRRVGDFIVGGCLPPAGAKVRPDSVNAAENSLSAAGRPSSDVDPAGFRPHDGGRVEAA